MFIEPDGRVQAVGSVGAVSRISPTSAFKFFPSLMARTVRRSAWVRLRVTRSVSFTSASSPSPGWPRCAMAAWATFFDDRADVRGLGIGCRLGFLIARVG